jgi:signal transduction histidine kinase
VGPPVDPATLLERIAALERENRRTFDEAQREADALFAQYQLSQLLASGGPLQTMGSAVLVELLRLAGAAGGALWVGRPGSEELSLVTSVGLAPESSVPVTLQRADAAHAWAETQPGGRTIALGDAPQRAVVVLWPDDHRALDEDGLRIALLARHELAVAFEGARLRETLERERMELSAIVEGTTDLILQVDGARRVVRLNPSGERLLGTQAADAVGRPCDEVLGCEVAGGHGAAQCPLAEVLAGGPSISYRETAIRGPGGAPLRVAGSYAATDPRDQVGGDAKATAILRDLTAVRVLEELREGFVATVSHELRTPIALIRGYAETLLHLSLEPAQQRSYVERIDEATSRLAALVDQILDITHLQADPLILERREATFASLIARLRGDLAVSGDDDRIVLVAADDLPPLDVDIGRVGQILVNLVGNALKYAPDRGPVVIGAERDGDWLAVTIDDEGVGIPESDRALVLEPFHRAWNVRESRIPGTGLGLFICRRLVEAHGGTLTLGDRPDGRPGTRVRFTLPLAIAGPVPIPTAAAVATPASGGADA